jgi:hypothetical protein
MRRALVATALVAAASALAAPAAACPDWRLTGQQVSFSAGQIAAPQALSVVAGGTTNLGGCSQIPGNGYLMDQPDFDMALSGMGSGSRLIL